MNEHPLKEAILLPHQVYNIIIHYTPDQEIFAEHIRVFLAKSLNGVVDKYIGFTNTIHGRYTFGPAIGGHLIIDHSFTIDPLTLRRYLIDPQKVFTVKEIKYYKTLIKTPQP